ncbi:MAG: 3-phosphoshikimate 1-carboxyvinyltransferase [Deltaproteobacteria bacterium]|nr:3-phosphoshikimate 1-carboxyvinyltransferase [Deltaproteobacteria bacterium]
MKPIKEINTVISVPGSKSFTQRALIAAALARGKSCLKGALVSEDTEHLMNALRLLGANITQEMDSLVVDGTGGRLVTPASALYLGNNGTGLRFLTSTVALGHGTFTLDGNSRMRQRPIEPLVDALRAMGVAASCVDHNGCPPVEVRARGLPGGKTCLDTTLSSQYVSSLLLAAPYAEKDTEIEISGSVPSWSYVRLTLGVMARFGVECLVSEQNRLHIRAPQVYRPRDYDIEGDASSATYFMAAAAILGGAVKISNIRGDSLQGDLRFSKILETMGCKVSFAGDGFEITGPLTNHEDLSFDLNEVPDMVPALAVVAAFREGKTLLENIAHLRVKESDRIAALSNELRKIGARVEEREEEMLVQGTATRGAEIECYNDHRIAMSFAVAGLAVEGIAIKDPDCVKKSFPDFWEKLESLA